jgi:ABC-type multidrug transport system ATPase subunit
MSELLRLTNLALRSDGPTLTIRIPGGSLVGIIGPANSGKTEFLKTITQEVKPARGTVEHFGTFASATPSKPIRRLKPMNMARTGKSAEAVALATEALLSTRLWDVRTKPISSLSPSQQAASELIGPLTSTAQLLLIDRQLDAVDPWTLKSVLTHIRKLRARRVSAIIATNRLDLVRYFDTLIVLDNRTIRFAGTREELLRLKGSYEFRVTAIDQPGALSLVAPFAISVEESQNELRFQAAEGQEITANLLLEGYGNVGMVMQRPPSLEEALLSLLR